MATLEPALGRALEHEGVYSHDPDDVGAETYRGIARAFWPSWEGWRDIDAMRAHSDFPDSLARPAFAAKMSGKVADFYALNFWQPVRGDLIPDQGIADEVFEQAVNMGVGAASTNLQLVLNALNRHGKDWPDLPVDGRIGNGTLAACQRAISKGRAATVAKALNVLQGAKALSSRNEKFINGWLARVTI